eukprot:gene11740-5078_t
MFKIKLQQYSKLTLDEKKLEIIKQKILKKEEIYEKVQDAKTSNTMKTELLKDYKNLSKIEVDYSSFEQTRKLKNKLIQESQDENLDEEYKEIYQEEISEMNQKIKESEENLVKSILESANDEDIVDGCILEIHPGAGGDEASLFSYELYKMYELIAKAKGWSFKRLNTVYTVSSSNKDGIREGLASIKGENVLKILKYESGTHRVQRVPTTDSNGRTHTSTSSVIILPEAKDVHLQIQTKDLKIDTMKSSGAGGQSVNTTDSAVRITHIPTGTVVYCQDERDQHSNKARAMDVLRSRLHEVERQKIQKEREETRFEQRGTASRSDKIRTYNFSQDRITDHRVGVSQFGVENFLKGDVGIFDVFIDELILQEEEEKFERFFK